MTTIAGTFYTQVAADYVRTGSVHPGALQNLIEHGQVSEASKVLEVGCGTGSYIGALQMLTGCAASGIDPSAAALAQARTRRKHVQFRDGQAEELDFPDATFDLIFSVDVVHLVVDRERYFAEAYRAMRPGGRICTVTDSEAIIRQRRPMAVYFPETVAVELHRYPSVTVLKSQMKGAGFRPVEEQTVEMAYPLTDLEPYREKAFSVLRLISEASYRQGMAQMERELKNGPLRCVARHTLLWGEKSALPRQGGESDGREVVAKVAGVR